jgi:hypothetical protein
MPNIRDEFAAIVSGWTLTSDVEDLGEKIEAAARWTEAHGPLLADEEATVKMMIETQVARGVRRGDFEPYISMPDEEEECCRHCGKPFEEFSDFGCAYCDVRVVG